MSSPKPSADVIPATVTFDHRLVTKGSTTNKRRRRRPSSRNSTHMSSPERSKKLKRDSTEEEDATDTHHLENDKKALRLKEILPKMPTPCNSLKLIKVVGEGTFSTVYLVKRNITKNEIENSNVIKHDPTWRRWYAVKHLIPTSSPERILTEVECLRLCSGQKNVVPLLFCYRILGDVVLVMPYIENNKFNDVIRTMDHIEMKAYMKNLLQALSHIHSLGIIHRDIKPANFLYDRKRRRYGLVDFGLAQKVQPSLTNLLNISHLKPITCKNEINSTEFTNDNSEPRTPPYSKRIPFEDRTLDENNKNRRSNLNPSNTNTPPSTDHNKPTHYYDKRGCPLKTGSPGKKYINHRKRLKSEEVVPSKAVEKCPEKIKSENKYTTSNDVLTPPKKNKIKELTQSPILRRSPRKHSSRLDPSILEVTTSKQSNIEYEPWQFPRRSPRKHSSTKEVIKPISSLYKGSNSVLQPFSPKVGSTEIVSNCARTPGGYSKLTISGSTIIPSGGQGLAQNNVSSSQFDSIPTHSTPNLGRQRNMGVPYATSMSGANHAMNRHNSFTMLDPASGIPSDESFYSFSKTPRIASLTSRHSFEKLPSFGGSTNMASTLAALTGGPPNTNFSATLPSAAPSKRSELYSYAPLPSIPSMNPTSCTNVNTINSQFLSTVKFHAPSSVQTSYANEKRCHCFGMPKICNKCWSRRSQKAARAGTPGFRPPEVLLKYEHQTTAVDMWACGVIMLCILSRTYPFFRAPDDVTALAEVTTIMGSDSVVQAAEQYGKNFICSEKIEAVDLQDLCYKLSVRLEADSHGRAIISPPATLATSTEAIDLLKQMLQLFQNERITAEQALKHPLFSN